MFSYRDHTPTEVAAYQKKSIEESKRKEEIWKDRIKKNPELFKCGSGITGRYVGPGTNIAFI